MKYTLQAQQEFFYGGKTHKVGDKFEASDPDANILCCLGKAAKVEEKSQKLQTTAMKAEEPTAKAPVADTAIEETSSRRRRYTRRDMVPEE